MTCRPAQLDRRDLHVVLYPGRRGTAVFLHGVLSSAGYYAGLAGSLGDGPRLVVPDLLGHGESARPAGLDYTLKDHLDPLEDLIRHEVSTGPLVLGAHSLGCLILTALAARRLRDRVDGLIFLNYPRFVSAAQIHETLKRGSAEYRKATQGILSPSDEDLVRSSGTFLHHFAALLPAHLRHEAERTAPEALAGTVRHALFAYRPDEDLLALRDLPQLHLHGEKDRVAPPAFLEALLPCLPRARYVKVSGAGHHLLQTHPALAAGEIASFFNRVMALRP